jgi:type III pantothenate kinase
MKSNILKYIFVDAGNTRLSFYISHNDKIKFFGSIPTDKASTANITALIKKSGCSKIFLCSVVPDITLLFKKIKGYRLYIAGQNVKTPIKSFYDAGDIGMDRLVGAYAARRINKSTRLIIDFGTAITFDFLSAKGEYLGGMILPGIGSSLTVLSGCALLPDKIHLGRLRKSIPRNTVDSINKGIIEGFSFMINSLVKEYSGTLKFTKNEVPVITGGDAEFICKMLNFKYIYEPDLVIRGLKILSAKLI